MDQDEAEGKQLRRIISPETDHDGCSYEFVWPYEYSGEGRSVEDPKRCFDDHKANDTLRIHVCSLRC